VLSVLQQLEVIEVRLIGAGGVVTDGPFIEIDDERGLDISGTLNMMIEYPSRHRLHVLVTLDVSYGYPGWGIYSFQFLDSLHRNVFRYDNSPHRPALPTFPHHKHVGISETAVAHPQPSLDDVIAEVCTHAYP